MDSLPAEGRPEEGPAGLFASDRRQEEDITVSERADQALLARYEFGEKILPGLPGCVASLDRVLPLAGVWWVMTMEKEAA